MNMETKATMAILIHEIEEIRQRSKSGEDIWPAISLLLKSWVEANGLHPENVITINAAKIPYHYVTVGKGLVAKKENDGSILIAETEGDDGPKHTQTD